MTPSPPPHVSVVVAAYNVERYVGQAIASVLAQTEASLELLVVDDGSSDATRDVIRGFRDRRLRLIESAANRGVSAARNRALSEARGEWIAFLDADDWWVPVRLERLLVAAGTALADMVADDCRLIEDGARHPWSGLFATRGLHLREPRTISASEFIAIDLGSAKPLIRRDLLTHHGIAFDESIRSVEDFVYYLACLLAGGKLLLVPDAYYYYRARRDALTTDRVEVLGRLAAVAEHLRQDQRVQRDPLLQRAVRKLGRRAQAEVRYYDFVRLLKARRPVAAAQAVGRSPSVLLTAGRHLPLVLRARLSRLT